MARGTRLRPTPIWGMERAGNSLVYSEQFSSVHGTRRALYGSLNGAVNRLWRGRFNMRRREFITLIGGAAAAWPIAARAQQAIGRTGKMPRVGILMPGPATHSATTLDPFYRGLHELGYMVGQNLAVELRNGDWKPDRFSALAAELVALKVDIVVAWSTPTAAQPS